jgi:hypothetical protein
MKLAWSHNHPAPATSKIKGLRSEAFVISGIGPRSFGRSLSAFVALRRKDAAAAGSVPDNAPHIDESGAASQGRTSGET